jgi:short-subunit dehydrogenase
MKRAILTGASSGIGAALARELGRRGWAVALLARRLDLLRELEREVGGSVAIECDVTDRASVQEAVRKAGGTFDLAIANAGVGKAMPATKFNIEDAEWMVRVNILGMMYLFDAVIPLMVEQHSGRFAGVASLAGLRGLPATSVYSATKAAMQAFLEANRVDLAPHGVGVTIINPGFIETPMTEKNEFRMPFLMTAEKAARIIGDGLERGKRVIEFPRPMSLLMRTLRLVPDAIYDRATNPYRKRKVVER